MTPREVPVSVTTGTSAVVPSPSAAARAASRARRIGRGTVPPALTAGPPRPDPAPEARELGSAEIPSHHVAAGKRPAQARGERPRPAPGWIVVAVAAVFVLALALADAALWRGWHGPASRAELRERLLASVGSGIVKVLSYDYRHLDQDAAAAEAHLTGAYQDDYSAAMTKTIKPVAPRVRAVVQGEVGSSAVASVTGDGRQATVLILAQQTVTNTAQKTPRYDMVSLRVTAQLVNGMWLIAKLDQL